MLQVQTQIMDQSLAVMLWQLSYSKISFIVLIPGAYAIKLYGFVIRPNFYHKFPHSIIYAH